LTLRTCASLAYAIVGVTEVKALGVRKMPSATTR